MSVTTRAPRRRRQPDLSYRYYDIAGVLLLALAVVTILSLLFSDTGVLGGALSSMFRIMFGKGAWALPVVFIGLGTAFITGRRKIEVSHLTIGVVLVYVALLGVFAQSTPESHDYFDSTMASASGGFLGAVIAWGFQALLGSAMMIGLGAMIMLGLIFIVPAPIHSLMELVKDKIAERRGGRKPVTPRERPVRTQAVIEAPEEKPRRSMPVVDEPERPTKRAPVVRTTQRGSGETMTQTIPREGYQLPPVTLLAEPAAKPKRSTEEMEDNIETLESTLEEFGIDANVVEVATGPTVTRYEIQLGPGIRVARITALADNIAMNLAASHVRVEAPIPGKSAIGVEVPNATPSPVALREVCDAREFRESPSKLTFALGQDVSGANKYADLARMPHLLIGGATNSGKSIGLASIIMSLLLRNTPKDLRFVMIDPKRVELSMFDNIPHLMCPVIKDVKEAPGVLRAVWREMDRRYDSFSQESVRNIDGWNEKASFQDKMPYIVVVIDELADLMIQAAAEIETSICRLAQLARATGIHLVIATQRPSVDVITGTIKANISSRIAYAVTSQVDSRTILDQKGADSLIGSGDMLFLPIDASKPLRIQGCFVSEKEISAVCKFWKDQERPAFTLTPVEVPGSGRSSSSSYGDDENDDLFEEAVRFVVDRKQASTSMLQRKFSIGFQRASRLLDVMEERGIVGARDGPRPREVLISPMEVDDLFNGGGIKRYTSEQTRLRPELMDDPVQNEEEEDDDDEPPPYRRDDRDGWGRKR